MALKRPDGWLMEEYVTSSGHLFENGELQLHDNDPIGNYTGIFWFEFHDGHNSRRYSCKTAPNWLLALYEEATHERRNE